MRRRDGRDAGDRLAVAADTEGGYLDLAHGERLALAQLLVDGSEQLVAEVAHGAALRADEVMVRGLG